MRLQTNTNKHRTDKPLKQRFACLYLLVTIVLFPVAGWAQDIHTAHDHIPNFAANPTISSVLNGSWSNTGTWTPARIPGPSDRVSIRHTVTYDSTTGDADVIGIDAGGTLRFATTQSTRLRVGTLLVLANGALEVGTSSNPVPASFSAEIIIKNKPLNTTADPDQFGTGLLSIDGKVTMHGAAKSLTFVRLAAEPLAGQSALQLQQAVTGWQTGDLLVLPDSRQEPTEDGDRTFPQFELVTVQSVAGDGRSLTTAAPLRYTHPGAQNPSGAIDFLPHAGNLTRNILIRSENPSGTRGNTLYTQRADVDIRYVAFKDLGRTTIDPLNDQTNHIGRYPLHMHHLIGPTATPANGYQFTLIGNAVYDSNSSLSRFKWGITVHGSHYGLVKDNVMYNIGGAHFVTEDGSESFNVIERNFAVRGEGEGDRLGSGFPGTEGVGFWLRGPNNYVRDNVAANLSEGTGGVEAAYGFKFFMYYLGNVNIPNFKGADTSVPGQYTTRNGNAMPILEFARNETYGVIQGLTIWWLCAVDTNAQTCPQSVAKDMRIWHASRYAFYGYPLNNLMFDGLVVRGDVNLINTSCCEFGSIIWFGDYMSKDVTIRNADIQGTVGITLPYFGAGTTTVENSYLRAKYGITNRTSGAPGSCPGCNLPDRLQIIRNVRFDALPGRSLRSISMDYDLHNGSADLSSKDEVFVYDYQGQSGNNFRVYYREQATQNIAGGLAPCNNTTTRPEIDGITCPMTGGGGTASVPAAPSGLLLQ
jgi:hypothetical protein